MALVGRDAELAAVADAAAAGRAGDVTRLAVVGDAGLGKTALLAAAREACEDAGLTVLSGRAAEHERDVPFGLVADALDAAAAAIGSRRLESLGETRVTDLAAALPSIAAVTPPASMAERYRTHRALSALLELLGGQQPLALILDDLHWADAASLELVAHLLRRPPAVAHVLVL
ncbi:MAG TPA: ATP-binding protein, partial [Solirubrobacteraceae bacterium]